MCHDQDDENDDDTAKRRLAGGQLDKKNKFWEKNKKSQIK